MATASPKLTTKKQAETKPTTASRVTVTRKQGTIYLTYNHIIIKYIIQIITMSLSNI